MQQNLAEHKFASLFANWYKKNWTISSTNVSSSSKSWAFQSLAHAGSELLKFAQMKKKTYKLYAHAHISRVWLQGKSTYKFEDRVAILKQVPNAVIFWAAIIANNCPALILIDWRRCKPEILQTKDVTWRVETVGTTTI